MSVFKVPFAKNFQRTSYLFYLPRSNLLISNLPFNLSHVCKADTKKTTFTVLFLWFQPYPHVIEL